MDFGILLSFSRLLTIAWLCMKKISIITGKYLFFHLLSILTLFWTLLALYCTTLKNIIFLGWAMFHLHVCPHRENIETFTHVHLLT